MGTRNLRFAFYSALFCLLLMTCPLPLVAEGPLLPGTDVGGILPEDTTWTLDNSPYIVTNSVTVPASVTLTIAPGVVVKFADTAKDLWVEGTLVANGTPSPIVFTSLNDNVVGGVTGSGSPAPGDWGGLHFSASSRGSVLRQAIVRYGGGFYAEAGITLATRDITLTQSTIAQGYGYGLKLENTLPAMLASNTFLSNTSYAIYAPLTDNGDAITLSGNAATGNAINGFCIQGTVSGTATWDGDDALPFVVVGNSSLRVQSGARLALVPGTVVKFLDTGRDLWVDGALIADTTASAPIVFTSLKDDSVGGDTNNDSTATSPAPGDWGGLHFSASSRGSVLRQAVVRYGGGFYAEAGITLATRDITLTQSTIARTGGYGLKLENALPASLSANAFLSNTGYAIYAPLTDNGDAITLSGNAATGNAINGFCIQGTVSGTAAWDGDDALPFVVVGNNSLRVQAGARLALVPGTVVKFLDTGRDLWVDGTLIADTTSSAPIVFTSLKDDSVGGDTNNDSTVTSPAPGDWGGLHFSASSRGSILRQAIVRYGGGFYAEAGITLATRDITLTQSTIARTGGYGLKLESALPASLSANTFLSNTSYAVYAPLTDNGDAITLSGNAATGNAINGLCIQGTISGTAAWDGDDALPFVVMGNNSLRVQAGAWLTLAPNTVVKFVDTGKDLWVDGVLVADTTSSAPIVFTSLKDDSVGGDTNNDGTASSPAPGDWGGLHFSASSRGSVLDAAVVRYGGGFYADGNVTVETSDITLAHNTLSRAFGSGLVVAGASPTVAYNTVRNNTDTGIRCRGAAMPTLWANAILANAVNGVYSESSSQPLLRGNQIAGNLQYGVRNADGSAPVDAEENWWGAASGPHHDTANPGGTGDAVSDGVLFRPWLSGLAWLAPQAALVHGTETLEWALYGRDPAALTVSISVRGESASRSLGSSLPASGTLAWDTRTLPDGLYDLTAQARDASAQVVSEATRRVTVLNNASIRWHSGRIAADEVWDSGHMHLVADNVTFAAGAEVVLQPGTVVKVAAGKHLLIEDGASLQALGTATAPITFTSLADDALGGDTNLDGDASRPQPGDWAGIRQLGSAVFGHNAYTALLYMQLVHRGALAGNETWSGTWLHRVEGEVVVPDGATLAIEPGAVVKFGSNAGITVRTGGLLQALGTVAQPIACTSLRDDSLAGDSNRDGTASAPAAGDWRGLYVNGGRATLDHLLIAYAGGPIGFSGSTTAALSSDAGATVSLANSTLREAYYEGIIAWSGAQVNASNSLILGADRGVNADGSSTLVRLTNCTLDDSRIGIWGHGGRLEIRNTLIVHSIEVGIDNVLNSPITLRYSDVWSSRGVNYGRNITDQTGVNGNISADPHLLDPAGMNYRLDYRSPAIDAADGLAAPATDLMGAPRYDDPRTPNAGIATSGGAYADMGAYEFVETANSNVDLLVSAVSGPASVLVGEPAVVQWTVTNVGTEPAVGPWHDLLALVLSPDARPETVQVAEVLSGQGARLGPGQSLPLQAEVLIPGAVIGDQFWQVTTNSRSEVYEGRNTANNRALSQSPTALQVTKLAIGGPALFGQFTAERPEQWFRFDYTAGQDILVSLEITGGVGVSELYLGRGYVPTPVVYDARSGEFQAANTTVLATAPLSGTFYLLARATSSPQATLGFRVQARAEALAIIAVRPLSGGNAGQVTLNISGHSIPEGATARLVHPVRGEVSPTAVYRADATHLIAAFDLRGLPTGPVDVALAAGSQRRTLPGAFRIVEGGQADFWWQIEGPTLVRTGRSAEYVVTWGNRGSIDAPVHLIRLSGSSAISMALGTERDISGGYLFLAMTPDAAAPALPPGTRESLRLQVSASRSGDFSLAAKATSLADPALAGQSIDWAQIALAAKPAELSDEQWGALFREFTATLGSNWAQVGQTLARDSLPWLHNIELPGSPREAGISLRPALLNAIGRAEKTLGWNSLPLGATSAMRWLAGPGRPGRLLPLIITIQKYHGKEKDLRDSWYDANRMFKLMTSLGELGPEEVGSYSDNLKQAGQEDPPPEMVRRDEARRRIKALTRQAGPNDTVFIYLSGHGDEPSDYTKQDGIFVFPDGAYEYRDLLKDVAYPDGEEEPYTRAGAIVIIVDACNSGSLTERINRPFTDVPYEVERRLTILTAASDSEQSQSWTGCGSTCSHLLYLAMKDKNNDANGDGVVSVHEALAKIPKELGNRLSGYYHPQKVLAESDVILQDPSGKSKEGVEDALLDQPPDPGATVTYKGRSGAPHDPNDKLAPGVGLQGWVAPGEKLVYTVHFENIPPAGMPPDLVFPAQEVVITDRLSTNLDWSTLELEEIGFNNTVVQVLAGRNAVEDTAYVSTDPNPVAVNAYMDTKTGIVTWRMCSVDPVTGGLPEDPLAGFLPANDATHRGEGYVTYCVSPKAGLATGSVITNQAAIVFDVNPPMFTGIVTSTLDLHPPTSQVKALPATSRPTFSVTWSGSDGSGAGIAGYDVYASDNGGAFVLWQSLVTQTTASYVGRAGHRYGFYSVATDLVGNRQATPSGAQATTTVADITYGVALSPSEARSGTPGSSVRYTLTVTNTGNATDVYTVTVSGSDWPVSAPPSIGPLAAGGHASLPVTVTVPVRVTDGVRAETDVTVTSRGNATVWARASLTTTASVVSYKVLLPLIIRNKR